MVEMVSRGKGTTIIPHFLFPMLDLLVHKAFFAFGLQELANAFLHRGAAEVCVVFHERVPSLIQFTIDFAAKRASVFVPNLSRFSFV